jgi:hypothetical protein
VQAAEADMAKDSIEELLAAERARAEWIQKTRERLAREEEGGGPKPTDNDLDDEREEWLRQLRVDMGQLSDISTDDDVSGIINRIAARGDLDELTRESLLQTIRKQVKTAPISALRKQLNASRRRLNDGSRSSDDSGVVSQDPGGPPPAEPDPEEIDRIKALYPLPAWIGYQLEYYPRRSGEVWVHNVIYRKNQETNRVERVHIPLCSPFCVVAWLRLIDLENAYGVRLSVADRDGQPRPVDFHRSELARVGATEVRARLMEVGLRIAKDGERVITDLLKEIKPQSEIAVTSGCGWHRRTPFLTPEGEELV